MAEAESGSLTSRLVGSISNTARWLVGSEPSPEEQQTLITKLQQETQGGVFRDMHGTEKPVEQLPKGFYRRFLIARSWSVDDAKVMINNHLKWRQQTLPIKVTPEISAISAADRFRFIGFSDDGQSMQVTDWMWGSFTRGIADEKDILWAYILFLETCMERAEKEANKNGEETFITISIGGAPPMKMAQQWSKVVEDNYPERMGKCVIYPVPPSFKKMISMLLWFVPERTRRKFNIASSKEDLASQLKAPVETLPGFLDLEVEKSRMGGMNRQPMGFNEDGDEMCMDGTTVKAGTQGKIQFPFDPSLTNIKYRIDVAAMDVTVTVTVRPISGGIEREPETLVSGHKLTVGQSLEGEALVKGRQGQIDVDFDNSYSILRSKETQVVWTVRKATEGGEEQGAE